MLPAGVLAMTAPESPALAVVVLVAVLGVVLANLRKERSMEQGEMARRMGLSQASYSRLEGGKSSFTVDQMFQAADALNIPHSEIHERLQNTALQLHANGVHVVPQVRGNTILGRDESSEVSSFVVGAALGALLIGILAKK